MPTDLAAAEPVWHPIAGDATTVGAQLAGSPWPDRSTDDYDWWYTATVASDTETVLTFDGITFPATVFVDDVAVAEVASMFLPVAVPLAAGTHLVHVRCSSLTLWLRARRGRGRWRSTLIATQGLRWARTTLLGRAPVYGGGALPAPVGIWRPVRLAEYGVDAVRITAADNRIAMTARVWGATGIRCVITDPTGAVLLDATRSVTDGIVTADVDVPAPRRWWPRGYGDQPLYRIGLWSGDDRLTERVVGFRSVTADTSDGGFTVAVNGVEIFARGVTWTPVDPVGLTVDTEILAARLISLADAGATMVRVVGGLVYEQPEFYRLCAEHGLLVWQDVMQATFDPPDDVGELMCTELATLLTDLGGNPALAVISGGSETIQQPEMFGVDPARRALPLLTERFPAIVAAHGDVPFVPSSPWSPGHGLAIRPDVGVAHWFGVGGYLRPLDDVRTAGVRFAAESLAFAIPPSDAAIERDFGSLSVVGHHPRWKAGVPRDRTAAWDFEDVRDHYVRAVFDVDPAAVRRTDPARYLQLGRAAVAEAMSACYRFWRQRDSRCAGALVLSGGDLVTGAGWGLFDRDGTAKLPVAALRRHWAPTTVTVSDAGLSGLRIDVHHDGPEPLIATLSLHLDAGHVSAESITVPPHSTLTRYDHDLTGEFADLSAAYRFGPLRADAVEVRLTSPDDTVLARDVIVLAAPGPPVRANLTATVRPAADGRWTLVLGCPTVLRYVCVDVDGWSAGDDCFALVGGIEYAVTLIPESPAPDVGIAPRVTVSSIDSVDAVTATVETGA